MPSITAEEMALLCLYDTRSRQKLLNDLCTVRPYIDDPEMLALSKSAESKLLCITDREFRQIAFASPLPKGDENTC